MAVQLRIKLPNIGDYITILDKANFVFCYEVWSYLLCCIYFIVIIPGESTKRLAFDKIVLPKFHSNNVENCCFIPGTSS